jgi:beta-glucanase (GH16 family)
MYPQNTPYVSWPDCGEIDVLENDGRANGEQGTLHYHNYGAYYAWSPVDVGQWHTYRLDWYTNSIQWVTDGITNGMVSTWDPPSGYSFPAPFDWPFYFVINLAIGGGYTGDPPPDQISPNLPAEMQLDYIRVYDQTEPLALSLTRSNEFIVLTWPSNIVCHLQAQSSISSSEGGATNWTDIFDASNPYVTTAKPGASFFRLASP